MPSAPSAAGSCDYNLFRSEIRNEITIERLRNRDLLPRIEISRREVEEYLRKKERTKADEEFNLSHILNAFPPGASEDDRAQAAERARSVYLRAKAGEDFAQLAVANSAGQQALEGGKIGWRKTEQLPTLFADVVIDMGAGDVSEPIPSPSGFHIVRVDELRGPQQVIIPEWRARHILIAPNELITATEAEELARDLHRQILDGADFAELAEEHSADRGSASAGGELSWARPGTFVPPFENAIRSMSPGDISEPVRSQFGWHIVELLEQRETDASEEVSMNQAYIEVRARKLQQATEDWLLRMRDEAFVEYLQQES